MEVFSNEYAFGIANNNTIIPKIAKLDFFNI